MTDISIDPVSPMALVGYAAPREDGLSGEMYFRASMRFVERETNHFTTLCSLRLHFEL